MKERRWLIAANRSERAGIVERTARLLGWNVDRGQDIGRALRWIERASARVAFTCVFLGLFAHGFELYLSVAPARLKPRRPVDINMMNDIAVRRAVGKLAQQSGVAFDTRSQAQVIAARRARGDDVVIRVSPNEFLVPQPDGRLVSTITIAGKEVVPLGRAANRDTVWCNESGEYVVYPSDERGFRNAHGAWGRPPIEIGVTGSSFALGGCVKEGFVDLIRHHHPATLNVGMGGLGPLMQLATLKEYLREMRPPIFLWVYHEAEGFPALRFEKRSRLLMRYLRAKDFSQGLVSMQAELDRAITEFGERKLRRELQASAPASAGAQIRSLLSHTKLPAVRARLWPPPPEVEPPVDASDLELLGEVLDEARSTVAEWQGTMYVVYLPSYTRYSDDLSPAGKARDAVLNMLSTRGIPVIDIDAVFQRQPDPLALFPFRRFAHYTEQGHDLIAQEVLHALSERGTAPAHQD